MSKIVNDDLVLSSQESKNLLQILLCPDKNAIDKRNSFLLGFDDFCVEENDDDMNSFEVPELDDTFMNQLIKISQSISRNESHDEKISITFIYSDDFNNIPSQPEDLEEKYYCTTNGMHQKEEYEKYENVLPFCEAA